MTFTDEELSLIKRISVADGWDDKDAQPLKGKIKPYLLALTSHRCCYCRLSMHEWHGLTIDIEHVLPKGAKYYPQFMFELKNLSVSCKRCNMGIKRDDVSFYIAAPGEVDPFKSEHYTFVHPNLDVPDQHLACFSAQFNEMRLVKYYVLRQSPKGNATYEYFKLSEVEVNSFDRAQGLVTSEPSESFPAGIHRDLRAIVDVLAPGPVGDNP
jgi:hypothetical protein